MKHLLTLFLCLLPLATHAAPTATIIESKTAGGEISYPQLSGLADPGIEKAINADISAEAKDWVCDTGPDDTGIAPKIFNTVSEVRLLDENAFSYTIAFGYDCGGPYPDAHMETRNYDLKTGALVTPQDVFVNGIDATIGARLVKNYTTPEGCEGVYDLENWDPAMWDFYLQAGDVVFMPSLPHVIQACVDTFTLPRTTLKTSLKPGTLLTR